MCTTSFSVGYNGATYGYFKGRRGLRQGDPLSPYLFVLSMNCLSLTLNKAAQEGKFKYHPKCQRSKLTHLCFADDLLIFMDGTAQSVCNVLEVLKDFELKSGLAVNLQKTTMFTTGLKNHEVDQIKALSNLSSGVLPVCYLGVPLCTKKLSLTHCAPLIQSIKSRLHSWTVKPLSYAGRLQLLSTVIAGITNFWSSSFILPKGCINEINSLCSKFLWKGKIEGHAGAKAAWESVTQSKAEGGLGLKNLSYWNTASAMKLIWLLFFVPNSVWASWYITEVLDGNINNFWIINTKQKHTWLANQLLGLREKAYLWIKQKVGNGKQSYFWSSNWSPYGNLNKYLDREGGVPLGISINTTLAELRENGHWIMPPTRSERQVQVFTYLSTISISNHQDTYEWWPNDVNSSTYSTKTIYNLLREEKPTVT